VRSGATQSTPSAMPLVTITVDGDTHSNASGGRLLSVYADEQVWGGQYTIELDNSDETLYAEDYKGLPITINFAFADEAGSSLAPLWVEDQKTIYREGKRILVLNCIDAWGLLARAQTAFETGAQWNQEWQKTGNIEGRLLPSGATITEGMENLIKACYDITIVYDGANDGIVDALIDLIGQDVIIADDDEIADVRKPPISIKDPISGVRQLMEMTKMYLLWKNPGGTAGFYTIQPSEHGLEAGNTFDVDNKFFSNVTEASIVIPNRIVFYALNEAGTAYVSGTANNEASQKLLATNGWDGVIPRYYLLSNMSIDARQSEVNLAILADAALDTIEGERSQGKVIAPMHCGTELFDLVRVVETRNGSPVNIDGYVHHIIREYRSGVYQITLELGGVTTGYTPPGGNIPLPLAEYAPPKNPGAPGYHNTITIAGGAVLIDGDGVLVNAGISDTIGMYRLKWGDNNAYITIEENGNLYLSALQAGANVVIADTLAPVVDNSFDLGSESKKWKDIHLSGLIGLPSHAADPV